MDANLVGLIIGILLAALTLFLIFWGNKKSNASIEAKGQSAAQADAPAQAPAAVNPEDLTIVEGIGPKINALLQQNGIHTFAQLAAADVAVLVKILKENGLQFAKPNSWPEQARLAAEGKMDELKTLQDKLIAGR